MWFEKGKGREQEREREGRRGENGTIHFSNWFVGSERLKFKHLNHPRVSATFLYCCTAPPLFYQIPFLLTFSSFSLTGTGDPAHSIFGKIFFTRLPLELLPTFVRECGVLAAGSCYQTVCTVCPILYVKKDKVIKPWLLKGEISAKHYHPRYRTLYYCFKKTRGRNKVFVKVILSTLTLRI